MSPFDSLTPEAHALLMEIKAYYETEFEQNEDLAKEDAFADRVIELITKNLLTVEWFAEYQQHPDLTHDGFMWGWRFTALVLAEKLKKPRSKKNMVEVEPGLYLKFADDEL